MSVCNFFKTSVLMSQCGKKLFQHYFWEKFCNTTAFQTYRLEIRLWKKNKWHMNVASCSYRCLWYFVSENSWLWNKNYVCFILCYFRSLENTAKCTVFSILQTIMILSFGENAQYGCFKCLYKELNIFLSQKQKCLQTETFLQWVLLDNVAVQ